MVRCCGTVCRGFEGQRILVPSRRVERPDEETLAARFGEFLGEG